MFKPNSKVQVSLKCKLSFGEGFGSARVWSRTWLDSAISHVELFIRMSTSFELYRPDDPLTRVALIDFDQFRLSGFVGQTISRHATPE